MFKIYRAVIVLSPSYEESSDYFEAFFTSEPEASKALADAVCRAESEFNVVFNDDGEAESDSGWLYTSVDAVEVFESSSEHTLVREEERREAKVGLGNLLKPSF